MKIHRIATAISMLTRALQDEGLKPPIAIVFDADDLDKIRHRAEDILIHYDVKATGNTLAGVPIEGLKNGRRR